MRGRQQREEAENQHQDKQRRHYCLHYLLQLTECLVGLLAVPNKVDTLRKLCVIFDLFPDDGDDFR